MIKIAVIGDIHLPFLEDTCQYKALDFAVDSIKRSGADAVVCIGDATADGNLNSAKAFLDKTVEIDLPKLFIIGNSDLRTNETKNQIGMLRMGKELEIGEIRFLGLDDADGNLSEDDKKLLMQSNENTVVFSHHPPRYMGKEGGAFVSKWLEENEYKAYVYGHMHVYERDNKIFSVQALDPDKAIGEPPCVTYMIFDGDEIRTEFDYFYDKMPEDIKEYLGLSCFFPETDIAFAADNGLKKIELRPSAVDRDIDMLLEKIKYWKERGGEYLSLHMPDFGYKDGLIGEAEWIRATEVARALNVNGVTVHVPKASVRDMKDGAEEKLLDFIEEMIKRLPENCAVGIENMHMTEGEKPDENRRFGYIPEECIEFVEGINKRFGYDRVGSVLDVGHARNNAPYSQKYNLSSWYKMVGSRTVAYHIHQVIITPDGMENHTPITEPYGALISYCSFSYCWNNGIINRKPVFLEIRGGIENYKLSVKTFLG